MTWIWPSTWTWHTFYKGFSLKLLYCKYDILPFMCNSSFCTLVELKKLSKISLVSSRKTTRVRSWSSRKTEIIFDKVSNRFADYFLFVECNTLTLSKVFVCETFWLPSIVYQVSMKKQSTNMQILWLGLL
jgi:hypothetical protein